MSLSLVPAAALLALACGGSEDNLPPPPAPPPPPPAPADAAAPMDNDGGAPATPPPPVTLLPGTASPDPEKAPTVKIAAPAREQVIAADKVNDFAIKLDVNNWATATGAAHVHLILDNKPYKPIYDPKKPIKMSDLTKEPLAEGQHVLVAFPSRASHESVKTSGALAITEFYVGHRGQPGTNTVDIKKPMLIYSRPKGDYKGDMANHVLIDFQLANDKLGDPKLPGNTGSKGDHVHLWVSGPGIDKTLESDAVKFGPPFYLDNLIDGKYTIKAELQSADGQVIAGPWNSTTREINVDHEGTPDPMPGMNMSGTTGPTDAGTAPPKH
jgi:hypothetical protein